ncbi:hypothetical protein NG799_02345 [Laspinema sp. D1]|uniref:Uncharacterized protein n=1 Tax=Laspinema palackyanum D2a TaxID=2953684 RepID=A0ABT2MKD0_9CYAN|nr:hypothetical protein [Laspinema sp. D2a]
MNETEEELFDSLFWHFVDVLEEFQAKEWNSPEELESDFREWAEGKIDLWCSFNDFPCVLAEVKERSLSQRANFHSHFLALQNQTGDSLNAG